MHGLISVDLRVTYKRHKMIHNLGENLTSVSKESRSCYAITVAGIVKPNKTLPLLKKCSGSY